MPKLSGALLLAAVLVAFPAGAAAHKAASSPSARVERAFRGVKVAGYKLRLGPRIAFRRYLLRNYSLDTPARQEAMSEQLRQVTRFLRGMASDLDGYPNRYFSKVEIVPRRGLLGPAMRLRGQTLYIGMRATLTGRLEVMDSTELRERWSKGHAWPFFPRKLRKYWPVLDPAGTARTAARRLLGDLRGALAQRLGELGQPDRVAEPTLRHELGALAAENLGQSRAEVAARQHSLAVIRVAPLEQLRDIATRWHAFVASPENGEEALEVAIQRGTSSEWNVTVWQLFGVLVNNMKHIGVEVGRMDRFLADDGVRKNRFRILAWQLLGVLVQLNDDVAISADLSRARTAMRALRGAALEHVFGAPEAPGSD